MMTFQRLFGCEHDHKRCLVAPTCLTQLAEWIVRKEIFPLNDDAREDGEQYPAIRHVFNHFVRVRRYVCMYVCMYVCVKMDACVRMCKS